MNTAYLILSDGTFYKGKSFGYIGNTDGEVVFNTGMMGYPETLTDPSYRGQILVTTYPLQGNYGVPKWDEFDEFGLRKHFESDAIHIRALIVDTYTAEYSHWQAATSLGDWLISHQIPAICDIDTRALTKKLREHGVMLGKIIIQEEMPKDLHLEAIPDPNMNNLVEEVSTKEIKTYGQGVKKICLVDTGVKLNIIRSLAKRGVEVIRVPYDYTFMDGSITFDGLFLANGPGDPEKNEKTIQEVQKAISQGIKTFGICLGNQLLALASGAKTYKLKYGHRGQNQPCQDILTKKCIITSQNHGFAVDENTLPDGVEVWFHNVNDGSNEGIYFTNKPIRSVQFHPESTPGPEDADYLFDEFVASL